VYDTRVFGELRSAVESLEVPIDGDAIVEGFVLLDQLTAKLSLAVAEFDAAKLWELDAATSAAVWLRNRAGMTSSMAHATVRSADRVRQLPTTAEMWKSGTLSGGQVRAIVANVEPCTIEMFAAQEGELLVRASTARCSTGRRSSRCCATPTSTGW
jgi:hypothetical protein